MSDALKWKFELEQVVFLARHEKPFTVQSRQIIQWRPRPEDKGPPVTGEGYDLVSDDGSAIDVNPCMIFLTAREARQCAFTVEAYRCTLGEMAEHCEILSLEAAHEKMCPVQWLQVWQWEGVKPEPINDPAEAWYLLLRCRECLGGSPSPEPDYSECSRWKHRLRCWENFDIAMRAGGHRPKTIEDDPPVAECRDAENTSAADVPIVGAVGTIRVVSELLREDGKKPGRGKVTLISSRVEEMCSFPGETFPRWVERR